MKTFYALLVLILVGSGCGRTVEKPANLISKDKMIDIFYDLALMESIRSQKPIALENAGVNPEKYIYKKYNIDSLQFAKSNQYYASDVQEYKKMYEEVAKRLGVSEQNQVPDLNTPQVQ